MRRGGNTDLIVLTIIYAAGRRALRGWTMDTHAQYYFQRKKMNAALHYMQRAMDYIARIKSAEGKVSLL